MPFGVAVITINTKILNTYDVMFIASMLPEACVHPQCFSCVIGWGQSGTGADYLPSTLDLPCQLLFYQSSILASVIQGWYKSPIYDCCIKGLSLTLAQEKRLWGVTCVISTADAWVHELYSSLELHFTIKWNITLHDPVPILLWTKWTDPMRGRNFSWGFATENF
jgi:hypothetical protein